MRVHVVVWRCAFASVFAAALWCTAPLAMAQAGDSFVATAGAERIDFNQATEAQLDGLRGVGPATTRRILLAREQRPFSDWTDLIRRVRGIGSAAAASFSAQGFVVNGALYAPPGAAAPAPPQQR